VYEKAMFVVSGAAMYEAMYLAIYQAMYRAAPLIKIGAKYEAA
jgi:hypothetical protein